MRINYWAGLGYVKLVKGKEIVCSSKEVLKDCK